VRSVNGLESSQVGMNIVTVPDESGNAVNLFRHTPALSIGFPVPVPRLGTKDYVWCRGLPGARPPHRGGDCQWALHMGDPCGPSSLFIRWHCPCGHMDMAISCSCSSDGKL
jgi:hypothetical protein